MPGSLTGRLYVQSTKDPKTLSRINLEIRLNVGSAKGWRTLYVAPRVPNNQHNYQYSDMHKLHISEIKDLKTVGWKYFEPLPFILFYTSQQKISQH